MNTNLYNADGKELEWKEVFALLPLSKINRVEVIDDRGRSYINRDNNNQVKLSFQDELKTLKVFISKTK